MSVREQLEEDLATAPWSEIKAHYQRGAVIVVTPSQSLVAVGVAFHEDQKTVVEGWLSDGTICKCSDSQAQEFENSDEEPSFEYLILQPFVLVKVIRKHYH
ncbi:MAG: DUF2288 domain-containing protein [Pseudomonadota bacterium]